tara:strand:+ start:160 stop:657 length:498 start_codon:yes stop_codon:yes gene_type:complete
VNDIEGTLRETGIYQLAAHAQRVDELVEKSSLKYDVKNLEDRVKKIEGILKVVRTNKHAIWQRALYNGNEEGWNKYTIPPKPEVSTVSNFQAKYPAIVRMLHSSRINASRTRANGKVTNASRNNGKVNNGKVTNGKVNTASRTRANGNGNNASRLKPPKNVNNGI